MSNFLKAYALFAKDHPELFPTHQPETVAGQHELFSKRIEFLKNLDSQQAAWVLPKIVDPKSHLPSELGKAYLKQAWQGKTQFSSTPSSKAAIELQQQAMDFAHVLAGIADFTSSFVFGSDNKHDYLGVPEGYLLGDLHFPTNEKRAENVVVNLPEQDLKTLIKNPLIPLTQVDGKLVLLGKDSVSDKPLIFSLGLPNMACQSNGYENAELPLFLHVGGLEAKQMGRISYKPTTSNHEQMQIDEKGRIVTDKKGNVCLTTFTTEHVHFHPYTETTTTNPRHYTSMIEKDGNDYLPENASCQDAIINLMDKFKVLHPQLDQSSDKQPLDYSLVCGALETLGLSLNEEDLSYLPITTELYDSLKQNYQAVLQGQKTQDECEAVTDEISNQIINQTFEIKPEDHIFTP